MSPLGLMLLKALRAGCYASAAFVALVILAELWKLWNFQGSSGNHAFLVVLVAMLAGFLWLARGISRELAKNG